jgi:hypothetical protein
VNVQLHAPAAIPPGIEPPGTSCIGGWVGPTTGLGDMEKILDPAETRTPIASRNTDCVIPADTIGLRKGKVVPVLN